jgi:hypothetical protein
VRGDTTLRKVEARDLENVNPRNKLSFPDLNMEVIVTEYHANCVAMKSRNPHRKDNPFNASGISRLEAKPPAADPAHNLPGAVLAVISSISSREKRSGVLLYAADRFPTPVSIGGKTVFFSLRRKTHPLPVTVRLLDFKKTEHPGTSKAKSFESRVIISTPELAREVVISMNKPLRYDDYSFYQSSYSQMEKTEASTLAVVQNPGRIIPYIASIVISLGLIIHFTIMLWKFALRKENPK